MLPNIGKSMNLSQHAYIVIKDAILNNKIKPKEVLSEEALAAILGISRTPLRTALKMLEFEKLIFINSAKNAIVADVAKEDMEKVFVVRIALEPVAVKIACMKMDEIKVAKLEEIVKQQATAIESNEFVKFINSDREFHVLIANYTDNELLSEMIERISVSVQRFLTLSMTIPVHAHTALQEHRMIVDALKAKDPDLAETRMLLHVGDVANRIYLS